MLEGFMKVRRYRINCKCLLFNNNEVISRLNLRVVNIFGNFEYYKIWMYSCAILFALFSDIILEKNINISKDVAAQVILSCCLNSATFQAKIKTSLQIGHDVPFEHD